MDVRLLKRNIKSCRECEKALHLKRKPSGLFRENFDVLGEDLYDCGAGCCAVCWSHLHLDGRGRQFYGVGVNSHVFDLQSRHSLLKQKTPMSK